MCTGGGARALKWCQKLGKEESNERKMREQTTCDPFWANGHVTNNHSRTRNVFLQVSDWPIQQKLIQVQLICWMTLHFIAAPLFFSPCKDNVGLHAGLTRSYSRLVWNVLTYLKLHFWQPCSCFHHISWSAKVKKLRRWQAKDESCNFRLPRESDTDSTCFKKKPGIKTSARFCLVQRS